MLPSAPPLPDALLKPVSANNQCNSRQFRERDDPEWVIFWRSWSTAPILFSRYGRPPKGSRTEQRGLAAQAHIQQEVRYLCEIIKAMGEPMGDTPAPVYEITFKQLFDVGSRSFVRTLIEDFHI